MLSSNSSANRFTFNPSLASTQLYQPASVQQSFQPVYANDQLKQNYQSFNNQQYIAQPSVNKSTNVRFEQYVRNIIN
jgi:hypothetical protein